MSDHENNSNNDKQTNSGTLPGEDEQHPPHQRRKEEEVDKATSVEDLLHAFQQVARQGTLPQVLERAGAEIQDNKTLVTVFVKFDGRSLQSASDRLKDHKPIVMAAMQKNVDAFEFASPRLRDDPELVVQAVKYDGHLFKFVSERLRSDRDFIKAAVQLQLSSFYHASREVLLADEDLVMELVESSNELLESELVTKSVALKVVKKNGTDLIFLKKAFKADREIVWEAVKQNGTLLCHASPELQSDRDFVLQAVKQSGTALSGACDTLKLDWTIVFEAVKQDWHALSYVPDQFTRDREIIGEAVKHDGFLLYVPWSNNRFIVLEALRCGKDVFLHASDALKADREVVLEAVRFDGLRLRHASTGLRADRDIVLEAVRQNGNALEHADAELKFSHEVVISAVRNKGEAFQYAFGGVRLDPHVLGAGIRSSETFTLPQEIEQQLSSVISGIQQQHDWDGRGRAVSFQDETNEAEGAAVQNYAEQVWKHGLREKIWLLQQKLQTRADAGHMISILECGIKEEFHLANELIRLSPVFTAFADRGINWNGILFALNLRKAGVFDISQT